MKKVFILIIVIVATVTLPGLSCYAQNTVIIQQNTNQPTQKKVIEKVYVPVPVEKNTVLTEPVLLYGYLLVYPVDLGKFQNYPADVISNINAAGAFGRTNWRLPTSSELDVLKQNAKVINLDESGVSAGGYYGEKTYDIHDKYAFSYNGSYIFNGYWGYFDGRYQNYSTEYNRGRLIRLVSTNK